MEWTTFKDNWGLILQRIREKENEWVNEWMNEWMNEYGGLRMWSHDLLFWYLSILTPLCKISIALSSEQFTLWIVSTGKVYSPRNRESTLKGVVFVSAWQLPPFWHSPWAVYMLPMSVNEEEGRQGEDWRLWSESWKTEIGELFLIICRISEPRHKKDRSFVWK